MPTTLTANVMMATVMEARRKLPRCLSTKVADSRSASTGPRPPTVTRGTAATQRTSKTSHHEEQTERDERDFLADGAHSGGDDERECCEHADDHMQEDEGPEPGSHVPERVRDAGVAEGPVVVEQEEDHPVCVELEDHEEDHDGDERRDSCEDAFQDKGCSRSD